MSRIASQNAPSHKVVIPHFIFGGLSWFFVTLLIILNPEALTQHFYNPKLLSITHLLVLGWITMIIFGALYQLIPVILEVKLHSELLAKFSFFFLTAGTVVLAFRFWQFSYGLVMVAAGTSIVISVIMFVINILSTAVSSEKKIIERTFIISSSVWLLLTVSAGLTIAINRFAPFLKVPHLELLKLHAHAGIAGWFLQLIIGVSVKLLPMFMVSRNLKTRKLYYTFYASNAGLIIALVSLYFQFKTGVAAGALIVVSGIFTYLVFLLEAFKKRVKKQLDIGMKQSALSFIILVIPLFLIFPLLLNFSFFDELTFPMSVAYGSAIILGFITSLVMGQTYKTLPFIVWLKVYRGRVGKVVLPLPKELYSEKAAFVQMWLYAAGFAVLLGGISAVSSKVVLTGGIILFLSVALYVLNILKIVFHKSKSK